MSSSPGAWIRLIVVAALLAGGLLFNWSRSAEHGRNGPVLRTVAVRALAAGKTLEAADVEVELVWAAKDAPRIGRTDRVLGLELKNNVPAGAAITWADLQPAKKAPAPADGK